MTEDLRLRCIACENPIRPGVEQYDEDGNSWHPECVEHPLGQKVGDLYCQLQKGRDYIADLRTRLDAAEAWNQELEAEIERREVAGFIHRLCPRCGWRWRDAEAKR